jgi:hypothetical protein
MCGVMLIGASATIVNLDVFARRGKTGHVRRPLREGLLTNPSGC